MRTRYDRARSEDHAGNFHAGPIGDRSRVFYGPDNGRDHAWSQGSTNEIWIAVVGDSFTGEWVSNLITDTPVVLNVY